MTLNRAAIIQTMQHMAPGEYAYLETESQADSIRVSRLITHTKFAKMNDDPRVFSTACGIAIMKGNQPQYFVRLSAE